MKEKIQRYLDSLENNFFGWWIKNFRISVMLTVLLVGYGIYALIAIPKESSPEIKFGLVMVNTIYPGANPIDIDQLITTKIEDKIKNINGIDKISSTSSVGVSSIIITLKNETDTKDFINDLKTEVEKIALPTDAKDPMVSEISTANQVLFELMVYGDSKDFTINHLRTLAYEMADNLQGKWPIVDAKIGSVGNGSSNAAGSTTDNQYDIEVLVDENKMQQLGLTLPQLAQSIRVFNNNIPLGNYTLGDLKYDYRIRGKIESMSDLMQVPISINNGQGPSQYIRLSDIALVQRKYNDESLQYGGTASSTGSINVATKIVIYKANRSNIFKDAGAAKKLIEEEIKKPQYQGISVDYTTDLSEIIIEDYKGLAENAWQSVLLIFLVMRFFVGLRQSLIATFAMPLSFLITFIALNRAGFTLNFLTNFSLILTFGMGIDTVVVLIEAAYELMKKGFNSKTAVLLALKQYAKPNITSSLANMVVFLPMLALPGIMGKFLAYIPITIFITLAGSLFLALSINNVLFWKVNKNQNYYYKDSDTPDDEEEVLLSDVENQILFAEREGKTALDPSKQTITDIRIGKIAHWYSTKLHWIIERPFWRKMAYRGPVGLLILSFIFLSGAIGFKIFPSGDNEFMNMTVTSKVGTVTQTRTPYTTKLNQIISSVPELRNYTIDANGNTINIAIRLVKKTQRDRNSFEVQEDLLQQLNYLVELWYKVESKVEEGWPPAAKAVGISLVADNTNLLSDLKQVSVDFENYLKTLKGTMNVDNSSNNNPGQFEFRRDTNKLAELGLTPQDFTSELLPALQGQNIGTMTLEKKDRDIIIKYKGFNDNMTPETLLSTVINTRVGPIMLGSVAEYTIDQALNRVSRDDGDLTIVVDSDLTPGSTPTDFQPKLTDFAEQYTFPEGISYKVGGENAENSELIQATFVAFAVAIFLTFLILIYQFNSFKQSTMILYSIITAMLGVNIGLFITGNPYSMPFMIWFISLIGIVVNMAIFIIDKINTNITAWLPLKLAIINAGSTRFKPVVISSLTTILGIITLARKDEFWAGLARTVVFWLLFSSFMTLLSIPNLYYAVYKKKGEAE
jgi:multidrug efflux pump subunit AcrB